MLRIYNKIVVKQFKIKPLKLNRENHKNFDRGQVIFYFRGYITKDKGLYVGQLTKIL